MTDWNQIRENIIHAQEASSQFNQIAEILVESPDDGNIREFANRMEALQKELNNIQKLLGPASPVALDELIDLFTKAVHGHPSYYRLTPRNV